MIFANSEFMKNLHKSIFILLLLGCQTVRPSEENTTLASALEFRNNCESDPDFKVILLMATKAKSCGEALESLERIQQGSAEFDEAFKALVTRLAQKM